MNDKTKAMLEQIETLADKTPDTNGGVLTALHNCKAALNRLARRAEPLSAEYEQVELPCTSGPTIEFAGKLLVAKDDGAAFIKHEIWLTKGGAYVAVTETHNQLHATVIPMHPFGDIEAMQRSVMDAFNWSFYARSMVRKELGWSLRRYVD